MTQSQKNTLKVGITGATGLIGSYLLNYLIDKRPENKYTALSRHTNPPANLSKFDIKWQTGDLASKRVCKSFIKNLDTIIYLAHTNTPLTSDSNIITDAQLNLVPLLNLLETIKKSKKTIHIIYASSGGAVYGESLNSKPFKETNSCLPLSSYGLQKLTAEHYLRLFSYTGAVKVTVLRISNPYGVLLCQERKQGIIGIAINQAINNKPVHIFSSLKTVRDYVHLDDVAHAVNLCLYKKYNFEIFNIGSGKGFSISGILNLIENNIHNKINYKKINHDNSNTPKWNVLNIDKSKEYLKWEPTISLEKGIQLLCEENINIPIL